ncbi:MAG: hypothetical protein ACXWN2_04955 [Candidatus Limnocylindrales bacterium]
MGTGLLLEVHPDLPVTQVEAAGLQLTLLGFMLDPDRPEAGDVELLRDLATSPEPGDLPERAAALAGRWALLAARAGEVLVLTDPCGLRQVFRTVGLAEPWCASQAGLIAQAAGLAVDPAAAAFMDTLYFSAYREAWWPADTSPYREVRRLLPNRVLELSSGTARRFWPLTPIARRSTEAAAQEGARLLQGLLSAASLRQPLALALTSGLDSRTLLAASRALQAELLLYTVDPATLGTDPADLTIPLRLANRLGIPHLRVGAPAGRDPEFEAVYAASFDTPHASWASTAQELVAVFPPERLSVSGSCSEIARSSYRWHEQPRRLSAGRLTVLAQMDMDGTGYATAALGRWLEEAGPAAERVGLDLHDLFYWENRLASWLPAGQAEWDMAHDTFTPFACRPLLEVLLAADQRDRSYPEFRLHRAMIERMWPEVLAEPVNPTSRMGDLRERTKRGAVRSLRVTGLYRPLMRAYLGARSRRIERL